MTLTYYCIIKHTNIHADIRLTRGGIIAIRPNMISLQHRRALADEISQGLYRQYPFQVVHDEPRLHVLMSDSAAAGANCGYGYHGTKMKAMSIAIVPQVQHYAKLLASEYDIPSHQWGIGVEAIMYRDGNDGVDWHADDESEFGPMPVIGSLSLGATRRFDLRRADDHAEKIELDLHHGDLVIMRGTTQALWKHRVPKTKKPVGERINLTFRTVIRS